MRIMHDDWVSNAESDVHEETGAVVAVTTVAIRQPATVSEQNTLHQLINRTLDVVDELGDAVAVGLGLRDR